MMYIITPDSTNPGMQPRSLRFHPAKISRIQAFPNNSIAKYSTLCEAMPSNTVITKDLVQLFRYHSSSLAETLF